VPGGDQREKGGSFRGNSLKSSAGQALPSGEFEIHYAEMDRLAQSVFGGKNGQGAWLPAADIVETDSAYTIEIEVPGVRREDVDVHLKGNELVVIGEVKERKRERRCAWWTD